ncbi:MAG: hypothetical protein ACYC7A_11065 [Thermoanaerobaculia bacterium]
MIASALLLVCVMSLVAPHAHGKADALLGLATTLAGTATADLSLSPVDSHDSPNHEHPCLACALQHRPGLSAIGGSVVEPLARISRLTSVPAISIASRPLLHAALRGPPPVSSC